MDVQGVLDLLEVPRHVLQDVTEDGLRRVAAAQLKGPPDDSDPGPLPGPAVGAAPVASPPVPRRRRSPAFPGLSSTVPRRALTLRHPGVATLVELSGGRRAKVLSPALKAGDTALCSLLQYLWRVSRLTEARLGPT